jgi:tetratricopeptide (TPR) repeat protein
MTRGQSSLVLGLLALAGSTPQANADDRPMPASARAHHERALRHFEAQQYAEALAAFQAAYQLDADPVFLYGIAQAERLRGNCDRAIVAYETYLRTKPAERQADAARANIERCRIASAQPPSPEPEPEPAPAPAPAGHPSPMSVAAPSPTIATGTTSPWYADSVAGVLVVSGVALAVGGGLTWRHGRAETEAHNDAQTYDAFLDHSGTTYQRFGVGLMTAGGAMLAIGLVRYATRSDRSRTVAFTPGRSTWGLALEF